MSTSTNSTKKENDIVVSQVVPLRVMRTGEGGRYYDPANVREAILTTVRYGGDYEVLKLWRDLPQFESETWEQAFAGCCARGAAARLGLLLSVYDPPMERALDLMNIAKETGAEGVKAELEKWVARDL